jgi:flagellar hook protein FlgE
MVSGTGTAVVLAGQLQFNSDGTLQTDSINNSASLVAGGSLEAWSVSGTSGVINAGEYLNDASGIPWAGADAVALFATGDYNNTSFSNRSPTDPEFAIDFGQFAESKAIVTQYDSGGTSVVSDVTTNGRSVGDLQSLEITETGLVKGIFSTGATEDLYRIPLYSFANQEGLLRAGNNLYQASATSGDPQPGEAGSGVVGKILAFNLEQSNVDLATEFVKIIQFQRGFQASSRTISAAAELLQDLVNLAR